MEFIECPFVDATELAISRSPSVGAFLHSIEELHDEGSEANYIEDVVQEQERRLKATGEQASYFSATKYRKSERFKREHIDYARSRKIEIAPGGSAALIAAGVLAPAEGATGDADADIVSGNGKSTPSQSPANKRRSTAKELSGGSSQRLSSDSFRSKQSSPPDGDRSFRSKTSRSRKSRDTQESAG